MLCFELCQSLSCMWCRFRNGQTSDDIYEKTMSTKTCFSRVRSSVFWLSVQENDSQQQTWFLLCSLVINLQIYKTQVEYQQKENPSSIAKLERRIEFIANGFTRTSESLSLWYRCFYRESERLFLESVGEKESRYNSRPLCP